MRGLRLGLPKEYSVEGMQPEVERAVRDAAALLERLGATVEPVSLPHSDAAVATYYMIATAEAESVDDLGKMVVSKVQMIEGITRTLTCPVVNL